MVNKTGYWDGAQAYNHHVYSSVLGAWLVGFLNNFKLMPIHDLGCGLGNYLHQLKIAGFRDLTGYEGEPPLDKIFDNILTQDLTNTFRVKPGIVISFEVGEHIPKEFMDIYVDNLTKNCNSFLIISWAIRNQPGLGHVNCLDNDEVIEIFRNKGFILFVI